jgi:heme exporter protein CcmD
MNEAYIWGSYAVTFALLAAEVALLAWRARRGRRGPSEMA